MNGGGIIKGKVENGSAPKSKETRNKIPPKSNEARNKILALVNTNDCGKR